jgi:hypothetical protein
MLSELGILLYLNTAFYPVDFINFYEGFLHIYLVEMLGDSNLEQFFLLLRY